MYVDAGIAYQVARPIGWRSQFIREVKRDAGFYTIIACYFLIMLGLSEWFGKGYWLVPTVSYLSCFASIGALIFAASFAPGLVGHLARTRPRSPLRASFSLLCDWAGPARVAGFFLYLSLAVFMGAFTATKTLLPDIQPFWFDPTVAALDRTIHGGVDPWRLLHPFLEARGVTQAIQVLYSPGWLLVTGSFPLLMAAFSADRTLRNRYLLSFLLAWILNGTILAAIFMSGGPAFYEGITGDGLRYHALADYLSFDLANPISAAHQQADLWTSYLSRRSGAGAGISAFPSLHVTMAVLVACAAWKMDRRLGLALSAFAAVIVVGSVHLGWHYGLDGYYAVLSSLALWWGVGRIVRTPAGEAFRV